MLLIEVPSSVSLHDATPAAAPAHPNVAVTDPPTVICVFDNDSDGARANCLNSTVAVAGTATLPATSVDETARA